MIRVRLARQGDVEAILDRDQRLIGVHYAWANRLGDGATAADHLALVAVDDSDVSVGHIGLGPIELNRAATRFDFTPGGLDGASISWWKLQALAVNPAAQGRGAARALLAAAVERAPRALTGIYGNVDEVSQHAINWYRRQGFYISASLDFPTGTGGSGQPVQFHAGRGYVYFSSRTHNLTQHLQGEGDPRTETRIAQAAYTTFIRNYRHADPPREDLGYRLYARRVAATPAPACLHDPMGPRPLMVYGWDPQLQRACLDCHIEHLNTLRRFDDEYRCDCCQARRRDAELSWAALDDELLIVGAALCGPCRAGQCTHNQPGGTQPLSVAQRTRRGKRKRKR